MTNKIRILETQIEAVKKELLSLGDLCPGSLSRQYNVCGNPKCRCKKDPAQKHGPYYQLSFTRKGRSSTKFIKSPHVAMVKDQIDNYAKLRTLVNRWIDLSTQICQIKTELKAKYRSNR